MFAKPEDVKTAYRRLAQKFHPDLNKYDTNAEAKFKEVKDAYDTLSDATLRQAYDRGLYAHLNNRNEPGVAESHVETNTIPGAGMANMANTFRIMGWAGTAVFIYAYFWQKFPDFWQKFPAGGARPPFLEFIVVFLGGGCSLIAWMIGTQAFEELATFEPALAARSKARGSESQVPMRDIIELTTSDSLLHPGVVDLTNLYMTRAKMAKSYLTWGPFLMCLLFCIAWVEPHLI